VAMIAATKTETTSKTIHSFAVPRTSRGVSPGWLPSHSWEEAIEADSLCQNSEVAILRSADLMTQELRDRAGINSPLKKRKKQLLIAPTGSLSIGCIFDPDAPSQIQRTRKPPKFCPCYRAQFLAHIECCRRCGTMP
jgi:hypothetical protein